MPAAMIVSSTAGVVGGDDGSGDGAGEDDDDDASGQYISTMATIHDDEPSSDDDEGQSANVELTHEPVVSQQISLYWHVWVLTVGWQEPPGEGAISGQLSHPCVCGFSVQYCPISMPAEHARQEAIIAMQQNRGSSATVECARRPRARSRQCRPHIGEQGCRPAAAPDDLWVGVRVRVNML